MDYMTRNPVKRSLTGTTAIRPPQVTMKIFVCRARHENRMISAGIERNIFPGTILA